MIGELHQVHIDALQLQQSQELLHYSNHASSDVHISTDVMIDELHQVHIDALQLSQAQELQSASNHMSTEAHVMIDELPQVHNNAM